MFFQERAAKAIELKAKGKGRDRPRTSTYMKGLDTIKIQSCHHSNKLKTHRSHSWKRAKGELWAGYSLEGGEEATMRDVIRPAVSGFLM